MAKIIIFKGEKKLQSIDLKNSIVIGREYGDILIKNPTISARHMKIEVAAHKYLVIDLDSTNGTYLNDEKVASKELSDGDVIKIGNFTINFKNPQKLDSWSGSKFGNTGGGKTMVINSKEVKELVQKEANEYAEKAKANISKGAHRPFETNLPVAKQPPVAPPGQHHSAPVAPPKQERVGIPPYEKDQKQVKSRSRLIFISSIGANKVINLSKTITIIGSDPKSDVRIKSKTVGLTALILELRDNDLHVTFKDGPSYFEVKGEKIQSATIKSGERFKLGLLNFEYQSASH